MENKRGHMGKTVIFESKDDHDLFLKDYNSPSLTKKIFSNWMYQGKYNTPSIQFKENIICFFCFLFFSAKYLCRSYYLGR